MNDMSLSRRRVWLAGITVGLTGVLLVPSGMRMCSASARTESCECDQHAGPGEQALPISIEDDGRLVIISGANVQIVDGSGTTDGPTNGLGNLVIGYNEDSPEPRDRTGSHNLVVGADHSYQSYGGVVAGLSNTVAAPAASVLGGIGNQNLSEGTWSTVSGGVGNRATGDGSSVAGGFGGTASGPSSSVLGGQSNTASEFGASVVGGGANRASGQTAVVGGGGENEAAGDGSVVTGGADNRAEGTASVVSGGEERTAPSVGNWVAGSLKENF